MTSEPQNPSPTPPILPVPPAPPLRPMAYSASESEVAPYLSPTTLNNLVPPCFDQQPPVSNPSLDRLGERSGGHPPVPDSPSNPHLNPPSNPHRAVAPPIMTSPRSAAPPPRVSTANLNHPSTDAPTLAQIVRVAYEKGFSDVHLGVGEVPRYRNRGEIETTQFPETDAATFMRWLREILSDAEISRFEETLDFDGATQYDFARVRINIFESLHGPSMVLRLIPLKILTVQQLNLPPVFKDICHYHKGLILITGPTGSGKSTTLAAMVDYINQEMPKHIITIEDPVEFVHRSQKALIKHREVGMHTRQFDTALKAALREDPDIILVGEMRDQETVNTALKAAQTGHLVMGTLHTNSAVKTIERVLSLYQPMEQETMRGSLSESLVAVIAQGLCRTTDGKRAAFHDIMINTDAIRDYIRRGELDEIDAIIPRCNFDGMCTMNQSLYALYEEGRITEEVALEMSPKQNEMAQMLRGRV